MTALAIEDRSAWLAKRRSGLGGSDAAAICGTDKYRSPLTVYYEKLGQLPEHDAGEAAYWGTILEAPVAAEFSKRTGLTLAPSPEFARHREHPWMFANCDRDITEEPAIYEGKTTGYWTERDWDAGVPERVQLQCLHYLEVRELTHAYVGVLFGGQKFASFRLERDDRAIAALVRIEREFWSRVEDGNPPPADGTASTSATLAEIFAHTEDGTSVVLPPEAGEWLDVRAQAKATEKKAKSVVAEFDNKLKQTLGDAQEGWLDGRCAVTLKEVAAVDVAATTRKAYRKLHVKAGAR